MRSFNKLFVVSLPRCATVSMSQALGIVGVPTAHLGKVYRHLPTHSDLHHDADHMIKLFQQTERGDQELSLFPDCRGVADYPACCLDILRTLRIQYPDSLFINVRRDRSIERWLQSVEQQLVGLDILSKAPGATDEYREFMRVMRKFRQLTFGSESFVADTYLRSYWEYQSELDSMCASDPAGSWLQFDDPMELEQVGFERLCKFLQVDQPTVPFPSCDEHSRLPKAAFLEELRAGRVHSQTGIRLQ